MIEIYSLCYSDDNSMYVEESKDTTPFNEHS